MIVFSAFIPQSPLLLESIGKKVRDRHTKTENALRTLEQELYASQPEVIVLISGHKDMRMDAFSASFAERFNTDFSELGDFETGMERAADISLLTDIKESMRPDNPLVFIDDPAIDQGGAVALHLLASRLKEVKVVPLHYSLLANRAHLEFGHTVGEVLNASKKRIAVIATGDMAHCLEKDSPVPYDEAGKLFDDAVRKAMKKGAVDKLLCIDPELIKRSHECGLRPLLVLLGILDQQAYACDVLSYEHPYGVGYLTAQCRLA